jgi:signal transduction histidine kinase
MEDLEIENQRLKRDIQLLKQSVQQVKIIKKAYKDSTAQLKKKDKELEHQIKKTQAVFNGQTSIVITSNGEQIQSANSQFFKTFPFKDIDDFKNKHFCVCELFIDKGNIPHLRQAMDGFSWLEYIEKNPDQIHEAYMYDKFQKERIYEVRSSGNLNSEDTIMNEKVVVFTDITDIKSKEKELYDTQKLASLGEMISNIAHQWRQPLTAISGVANHMKIKAFLENIDFEELDKMGDEILETIEELSDTIETFRDLTTKTNQVQPLLIQTEISDAIKIVAGMLGNNTIELINKVQDDQAYYIEGIKGDITQVLVKIITNAKEIITTRNITNGMVILSLSLKDDIIFLYIQDNAGGINEEILPKIFDPYFTTHHKSSGKGLGLHMSYKIIQESFHGRLTACNEGFGAKFCIELPYLKTIQ